MDKKHNIRTSFVFYRSFYEAISEIDKNSKVELYDAIVEYALNGKERKLKGVAQICWKLIKPQLDANWIKFINGCKGGEFGGLGGAPKGNKNAIKKQPQDNPKTTPRQPLNNPKTTPNVNVNVNENDIKENICVKEKGNRTAFATPTHEDVRAYILEKGYNVDAAKFVDFYASKNWMVGKNKMKDWKAAVRNWHRNAEAEKMDVSTGAEVGRNISADPNRYKNQKGWK